ncbi:MAG: hypothetical protein FJY66_02005 [Calditrichaeota bacterium]|nr:hypothetical protein [Calditrichota bacterium]
MKSKPPRLPLSKRSPFEKARGDLERLLKNYDLSDEEYNQLIADIRRRQRKEKGREFDRLDEILED